MPEEEKPTNTGARECGAVVTIDELKSVDIEAPIRGSDHVDCNSLGSLYRAAASDQEKSGNTTAARVFDLLCEIVYIDLKPEDRTEPYGPYWVMDGHRSTIPGDLKGEQSQALAAIAPDVQNPGLRARLADIAWYNDKSLKKMAQMAIAAYCEAIELVMAGRNQILKIHPNSIGFPGIRMIHRACQIAQATGSKATGWKDPEGSRLKSLMQMVLQQVPERGDFRDFCEIGSRILSMKLSFCDPAKIAAIAEKYAASPSTHSDHLQELWKLAASAYGVAKSLESKRRCQMRAAECYVTLADAADSALGAEKYLMEAIRALRRLPNTKERRTELEKKLRRVQAQIPDEMGVVLLEIDLTAPIEQARQAVRGVSLSVAIRRFANLAESPNPDELKEQVKQHAHDSPLSSMMSMLIHDGDNKVVERSPGYTGNEADDADAIRALIVQNESFRRNYFVNRIIEPARKVIHTEHSIDLQDMHCFAEMSLFVPRDRIELFARGFTHFLNGDFVSALHILVPQLENSLRQVLKMAGWDPSTIKDNSTQEDRSLSEMLKPNKDKNALEYMFGTAIVYEIENLFLLRCGPMIRHRLVHGSFSASAFDSPDAIYASWFVFRLCCLSCPCWSQMAERLDRR